MSILIRIAKLEDVPSILEIYNDAIKNTTAVYHYKPHTLEERTQWYHRKLEERFPVLVAVSDDKIVGFATFGSFRPWPAYKYTIEHSVYVHPLFHRQGVGSALLRELIGIAKSQNYKTMVAGIDSSNLHSIKMHHKFGFEFTGTIKNAGYKFNRWLDLDFYQLELPGPVHPTED